VFFGSCASRICASSFCYENFYLVKIPSISIDSSFEKKTERFWLSANVVDTYIITVLE
jgi:hypothetical protein